MTSSSADSDAEDGSSTADTRSPRWWHHEWFRQVVATPPAMLGFLVPGQFALQVLVFWDILALVYLTLTWLAYRRHGWAAAQTLALASRKRSLKYRLLATSPDQLAVSAAVLALVTTAILMPRASSLGASTPLVIAICVVAIVGCWLTLQASFCIIYVAAYAEHGGLEFPGDEEPEMVDFLYFAVTVGTTFGTSDVTVTRRAMRRRVLSHAMLAFLFNALILAIAIGIVNAFVVVPR